MAWGAPPPRVAVTDIATQLYGSFRNGLVQ
jgi:hypothetical protein